MSLFKEKDYQEIVCNKFFGLQNHRLPSGKVIDVLCREYAIEVDYIAKWAESIGQSLQYAMESNRKPCIVYIYDSVQDRLLLQSIQPLLHRLCITVYTIDVLTRTISLRIL